MTVRDRRARNRDSEAGRDDGDWAPAIAAQGSSIWNRESWGNLQKAVQEECRRTKVAARFLPPYSPQPNALTVPADTPEIHTPGTLKISESEVVPLLETWVEFTLTPQQVERETELKTASTLAVRAANYLAQAQDLFIFQGDEAVHDPVFQQHLVKFRSGPAGDGLISQHLPPDQTIRVYPAPIHGEQGYRWGEHTFEAVAEGYALLQDKGHYGPYALVLHTIPYADTYAPLPTTLIMPADRIKPLVEGSFYGTGTLPESSNPHERPVYTGLLLSLGGNTMDLTLGKSPEASFLQIDGTGDYRFRISERFALRLKDETAIIKLEFLTTPFAPTVQDQEDAADKSPHRSGDETASKAGEESTGEE